MGEPLNSPNLTMAVHHYKSGNFAAAESLVRQELQFQPHNAALWCFLGSILRGTNNIEEAETCQREALRLQPGFPEAQFNLANILLSRNCPREAIELYQHVLQQQPNMAMAHYSLALALSKAGRLSEAVDGFREALRLSPNHTESHINQAITLYKLRRWQEAEQCCAQALALQPDSANAYRTLSVSQWSAGQFSQALESCNRAISLEPTNAMGYLNRSRVRMALKDWSEAETDLDAAVAQSSGDAEMHVARAIFRLQRGDYQQGWAEYEAREKDEAFAHNRTDIKPWDGSSLQGRTLFLKAEQGLGDTIQFIRYIPMIEKSGGKIIVACPKPLVRLLGTCSGIDQIVSTSDSMPEFDVYASLMSLPCILKTTLDSVPATIPYLSADEELVAQWKQELAQFTGLKVGIAWQGNRENPFDYLRSVPLTHWANLIGLANVHVISLQKGSDQLSDPAIIQYSDRLDEANGPFQDTAAIIRNLDLVISVDSVIAHLAGALGSPVWVVLSQAPEWRWLREEKTTPWYPNAKIFRYVDSGNWSGVFEQMAEELKAMILKRNS